MAYYSFEGRMPRVARGAFVHPEATLIGEVEVGEGCYIAAGARLRGDWGRIVVGPGTNIQENCVIHVKPDQTVVIGPACHIAHGAILHGPVLGYHVVVGMGAIVMDEAVLGDECCIAAGAFVRARMHVPPGMLVMGSPGKVVGAVSEELRRHLLWATALYQALPASCHDSLRPVPADAVLCGGSAPCGSLESLRLVSKRLMETEDIILFGREAEKKSRV